MVVKSLKIFCSVALCLILGFASAFYAFKSSYVPTHLRDQGTKTEEIASGEDVEKEKETDKEATEIEKPEPKPKEKTELEKLVEKSKRVNVLVFGHDGARADTMMVVSYDTNSKLVDIISVPRDTYYYSEGYDLAQQDKINAVYGLRGEGGGSLKLKDAVSNVLDIPIHYYVKVNYKGVSAIVKTIGGVEVDVPFDMDYDDPWAKPELHIHFEKGYQVINGDDAVSYLRWRKNNDGTGDNGDIGRIGRQQKFVLAAIKKAIGFKLPKVIDLTYDYVRTDLTQEDAIYFGSDVVGFDFGDIKKYTLPGDVKNKKGISYYYGDEDDVESLMTTIYQRGNSEHVAQNDDD